MAEPDDIDKLLREIDAMNKGGASGAQVPATPRGKEVAPTGGGEDSSAGGRVAWAGMSAVGGFFAGGLAGAILPLIGSGSAAAGAALGAALAAAISGPPGWFNRG